MHAVRSGARASRALARRRLATAAALAAAALLIAAPSAAALSAEDTPAPGATSTAVPPPNPAPTVTPTPPPTPTDTTSPGRPTPTPTDSRTSEPPEPSDTATPTPAPSESTTPAPATRPGGTAPAAQDSPISPWSVVLAVLVLAAAGVVLWRVARGAGRRGPREDSRPILDPSQEQPEVAPTPAPSTAGVSELRFLVELGEAMIDAGAPVTHAQTVLHDVSDRLGVADAEIVALPTLLMVSVPGSGSVQTAVAAAGTASLRLDQVDAVYQVVDDATTGRLAPDDGLDRLHEIRTSTPPLGWMVRTAGYVLLTLGLSLVLGGDAADLVLAAVLGLGVGLVQLTAHRYPMAYTVFAPVACSFGVSVVVLLVTRAAPGIGVFAVLVAPIITFLPGALLTTSAIELATGQMISGAGRLAAGSMRLVLLAVGIVLAAQLVGVPASSVDAAASADPLQTLAPWIGVAVFGVGVLLYYCARPASFWWILLVLYVAYAGQVIGGLLVGGVLSAFVGAAVMTPVAMFAARRPDGPPAMVSFLPAFWLLVPGALGLLGVTSFLAEDRVQGVATLVTTTATMVAIALGVLVGLAAAGALVQLRRLTGPARGA